MLSPALSILQPQPWNSELGLPLTPRRHREYPPTFSWIWGSAGSGVQLPSTLELPNAPSISALPWQCFTIERVGRRPLIITGFCAMGVCSAGITVSLLLQVGPGHCHPLGHYWGWVMEGWVSSWGREHAWKQEVSWLFQVIFSLQI